MLGATYIFFSVFFYLEQFIKEEFVGFWTGSPNELQKIRNREVHKSIIPHFSHLTKLHGSVMASSYSQYLFRLIIHAYFYNRCFKLPGFVYTQYEGWWRPIAWEGDFHITLFYEVSSVKLKLVSSVNLCFSLLSLFCRSDRIFLVWRKLLVRCVYSMNR